MRIILSAALLFCGAVIMLTVQACAELKLSTPDGMVKVRGGCFDMGDIRGDGGRPNELPVHRACVDDFYLDKFEVTQLLFQQVMKANPSWFNNCSNCPVDKVKWTEAQEYCSHAGKRLPTEAEWEYAARSGGNKDRYAGGENLAAVAWYDENSGEKTHPVGTKTPSALGLYDMTGNVWEWVNDGYQEDYYQMTDTQNPSGPATSEYKVLRGGSWSNIKTNMRISMRLWFMPDGRSDDFGFRCAL